MDSPIELISMDSWVDASPFMLIGIEVFNFKTYRGKHIIGPFTEFTCITGPSDSGKSNLMDAIAFALLVKIDKLRAHNIGMLCSNQIDDPFVSPTKQPYVTYVKLIFRSINVNLNVSFMRSMMKGDDSTEFFINDQSITKIQYIECLDKLGFNIKNKVFMIFHDIICRKFLNDPITLVNIIEEVSGSDSYRDEYEKLKKEYDRNKEKISSILTKKEKQIKVKKDMENWQRENRKFDMNLEEMNTTKQKGVLLELFHQQIKINQLRDIIEENVKTIKKNDEKLESLQNQKEKLCQEIKQVSQECTKLEEQINQIESINKCQIQSIEDKCSYMENCLKNVNSNKNLFLSQLEQSQNLIQSLKKEINELEFKLADYKAKLDRIKQMGIIDQDVTNIYQRSKLEFDNRMNQIGYPDNGISYEVRKNTFEMMSKEFELEKMHLEQKYNLLLDLNIKIQNCEIDLDKWKQKKTDLVNKMEDINKNRIELEQYLNIQSQNEADRKIQSKMKQEKRRRSRFSKYLQYNYSGIKGRLGNLCESKEERDLSLIQKIIKKHSNLIVADSQKTIQRIMEYETLFSDIEFFAPLDILQAPSIEEQIRYISAIPNVRLAYDMIKFEDPSVEKVVRFTNIGNTVICRNFRDALQLRNQIGDDNHTFCTVDGIFFNSQIFSADITSGNVEMESANDEYSILEDNDINFIKSLDKYLELLNIQSTNQLEIIHIEEQICQYQEQLEYLIKRKKEVDNEDLEEIKKKISLLDEEMKDIERESNEMIDDQYENISNEVYGTLLDRFNLIKIKEFEDIRQDLFEDQCLNYLEKNLKNLRFKLNMEESKISHSEFVIKRIEDSLQKESKNKEKSFEQLNQQKILEQQSNYENLKKCFVKNKEKLINLNDTEDNLNKTIDDVQKSTLFAGSTIEKLKFELKQHLGKRHELFYKSYNENIKLPLLPPSNLLGDLFRRIDELDEDQIYNQEDQFKLNFDKIPDIKITDEQEYLKMKFDIEHKLSRMEKLEPPLVTVTEDWKNQVNDSFNSVCSELIEAEAEFGEVSERFENIKKLRADAFNSLFLKACSNMNGVFKELMQNSSADAYLEVENTEEPYLGPIKFKCRFPNKQFLLASSLSKTEQILANCALIFSIYLEKLPAFFIMDGIDCYLDSKTTVNFGMYLKSRLSSTQFIVITSKPTLPKMCLSLIGICKNKKKKPSSSLAFSFDLRKFPEE